MAQVGCAALLALFYFAGALIPAWPLTEGLDPSWQISLAWAAQKQLQFGPDVAFTFGPLGYLECLFQLDTTVGAQALWQIATRIAVTAIVIWSAWQWPNRWLGLVWIGMAAVWGIGSPEVFHGVFAVSSAVLFATRRIRPEIALVIGLLLGAFALVKFSTTVLLSFALPCLAAAQFQRRDVRSALGVSAGFAIGCIGGWLAARQSLGNLPAFLRHSFEVASGYNASMALPSEPVAFTTALVTLVLFGTALGWTAVRSWREPETRQRLCCILVIAAATFLVWKHGFVRADLHMLGFFGWIAAVSPVVAMLGWRRHHLAGSWAIAGCAAVAAGLAVHTHANLLQTDVFALPRVYPERAWSQLRHVTRLAFDRSSHAGYSPARSSLADADFARVIGERTVDMHGNDQARLIANRLSLNLRPVLQSYSAYTSMLTELDAAHLRHRDGPQVVLLDYSPIDGRYPALEDASALRQLLLGYKLATLLNNHLVFERLPGDPPPPLPPAPQQQLSATFGEFIEIPPTEENSFVWISIHIEKTLLGRLREVAYKLPTPVLTIETEKGETLTANLPYRMAATPFLLSPIARNNFSLLAALQRQAIAKPRRIRVALPGAESCFEPRFAVGFWRESAPPPSPDIRNIHAAAFPEFKTPPTSFGPNNQPERRKLNGRGIVYLHAPASVTFQCEAGAYTLRGIYGILPDACTAGTTDGISLRVVLESLTGQEVLFEHWLRPREILSEQGPQSLAIPFRAPEGGAITLEINPGPAGDTAWDWSYLSEIDIAPQ